MPKKRTPLLEQIKEIRLAAVLVISIFGAGVYATVWVGNQAGKIDKRLTAIEKRSVGNAVKLAKSRFIQLQRRVKKGESLSIIEADEYCEEGYTAGFWTEQIPCPKATLRITLTGGVRRKAASEDQVQLWNLESLRRARGLSPIEEVRYCQYWYNLPVLTKDRRCPFKRRYELWLMKKKPRL